MREEVGEPPPSTKRKSFTRFKKRWKVLKYKTKTCITACFSISACILEEDGVAEEDSIAKAQICKEESRNAESRTLIISASQKPELKPKNLNSEAKLNPDFLAVKKSDGVVCPEEAEFEAPTNWGATGFAGLRIISAKADLVEEKAPHKPDLDQTEVEQVHPIAALKGLINHRADFSAVGGAAEVLADVTIEEFVAKEGALIEDPRDSVAGNLVLPLKFSAVVLQSKSKMEAQHALESGHNGYGGPKSDKPESWVQHYIERKLGRHHIMDAIKAEGETTQMVVVGEAVEIVSEEKIEAHRAKKPGNAINLAGAMQNSREFRAPFGSVVDGLQKAVEEFYVAAQPERRFPKDLAAQHHREIPKEIGVQFEDGTQITDVFMQAVNESMRGDSDKDRREINAMNKADAMMVIIVANQIGSVPIKCKHESKCVKFMGFKSLIRDYANKSAGDCDEEVTEKGQVTGMGSRKEISIQGGLKGPNMHKPARIHGSGKDATKRHAPDYPLETSDGDAQMETQRVELNGVQSATAKDELKFEKDIATAAVEDLKMKKAAPIFTVAANLTSATNQGMKEMEIVYACSKGMNLISKRTISLQSCCSREGVVNMSSEDYSEGAHSAQQGKADPSIQKYKAHGGRCYTEAKFSNEYARTLSCKSTHKNSSLHQTWAVICTSILIASIEKLLLIDLLMSYISKNISIWTAAKQRTILHVQVPILRICRCDVRHNQRHRRKDQILRYEADSDHG